MVQQGCGIGHIQYGEIKVALWHAKCLSEHLRSETGAAHTEQKRVCVASVSHILRQCLQAVDLFDHQFGNVQPAQPIGDLGRFRFPDCMIVGPDASDNISVLQLSERCINGGLVLV